MTPTRVFTAAVRATGLLIAIRFGLLEGTVLSGNPDPQMLMIAAVLISGAQGAEAIAGVIGSFGKKTDGPPP
jgi:hypothetical protein